MDRRTVSLALLIGACGLPIPSPAGVVLDATGSNRHVDATANAERKTAAPPSLFAFWTVLLRASPGALTHADASQTSFASIVGDGATLVGSGGVTIAFEQGASASGQSTVPFEFDADECMDYTLSVDLYGTAGIASAGLATYDKQLLRRNHLVSESQIADFMHTGDGPPNSALATGQISPGHFDMYGEAALSPNDIGPNVGANKQYSFQLNLSPCASPLIAQQPQGGSVPPGSVASLSVGAAGSASGALNGVRLSGATEPIYQWRRNGEDLVDDGRITGATTANLGIAGFSYLDGGAYSVRVSDGTTEAVSSLAILTPAGDPDSDGRAGALDDCPEYANPDQSDTDGDGRGDACECGDQNGDGRNTVSDIVAINLAIFDPSRVTPLCDANGDDRCDVSDIIAVNTEIFSPGSTSTCARQPVAGP